MATRRKSGVVNGGATSTNGPGVNYNFRPQNDGKARGDTKGTRPLPSPVSVQGALLTMLIHVCRRVIFFNTYIKVAIYAGIMFASFAFDMYPFPRSYFSQSSNFINQYFVKLGWGWTLMLTVPFVLLTSFTHCCGDQRRFIKHLYRIVIATINWYVFTNSFHYLENSTGRCSVRGEKFNTRQSCLTAGHFWHSLDISGHTFILIYSSLVMIEEARAIIGWDTISDLIRNEEHSRLTNETDLSSPLKALTKEELSLLKLSFNTFSPWIRGLFVGMTMLICVWDVMIISTALYFHTMVEKLVGAVLAIAAWFVTYRICFGKVTILPAPGQGLFQYNKCKQSNGGPPRVQRQAERQRNSDGAPSFMGMPLRRDVSEDQEDLPPKPPRNGPVTRSQAKSDTSQ